MMSEAIEDESHEAMETLGASFEAKWSCVEGEGADEAAVARARPPTRALMETSLMMGG